MAAGGPRRPRQRRAAPAPRRLASRPGGPSLDQAEFIRLQLLLEHFAAEDPARPSLVDRERDLLRRHWPAWVRPLCQALGEPLPVPPRITPSDPVARRMLEERGVGHYELTFAPPPDRRHSVSSTVRRSPADPRLLDRLAFRRGFVVAAALSHLPSRSPVYVARLFERAPIRELNLSMFPAQFVRQMLVGHLFAGLTTLRLTFDDEAAVAELLAAPQVGGLRTLALNHAAPAGGSGVFRALARSDHLGSLERLTLGTPAGHRGDFADMLASPACQQLRELALLFQVTLSQARALILWDGSPGLESLLLQAPGPDAGTLAALTQRFGRRLQLFGHGRGHDGEPFP